MRYYEIINEGRDAPLFHGTHLLNAIAIINTNKIKSSKQHKHDVLGVSLARDYRVAQEFGTYGEFSPPVIFVLDQAKLVRSGFKIIPFKDKIKTSNEYILHDETEERVLKDIYPLSNYLISINIDKKLCIDHAESEMWLDWIIRDYQGMQPFLENEETLQNAIFEFVKNPLINKWLPKSGHSNIS